MRNTPATTASAPIALVNDIDSPNRMRAPIELKSGPLPRATGYTTVRSDTA